MTFLHRPYHIIYLLTLIAILCACTAREATKAQLPENEIEELSAVIKSAAVYQHDMNHRIDSLRNLYHLSKTIDTKFDNALALSDIYRQFNTDSSLFYAMKCSRLSEDGNRLMQQKSAIARVNALSTSGLFVEAMPLFNGLEEEGVEPSLRTSYWQAGRTLYSNLCNYVGKGDAYHDIYNARYLQYDDSLLRHLPASSNYRTFLNCERLVTNGNITRAQEQLEELLKRLDPQTNLYGMAAFQMAEVYKAKGNETQYAAYLAKAAICDIKCGVREGMALPTLAHWLYVEKEFSDAFAFINFSLEDAMRGNMRMRTVSIAHMMPMIDGAYREKINSSRDELMVYFLLASMLFVTSISLIVILTRTIKRREENERKLASLSKIQETYIGNFIGLCSSYADRLDSLSKTVSRKLTAGQADDLLKLVNSGKFTDNGNEQFYATFDQAFLDIYPDFIDGINTLLRPDERVEIHTPHTLTPELRIYAFVRLGVEESTRIAQILHYSVSTVYAYRNRMRNKAIVRDSFDKDVMNIMQNQLEG